MGRTNPARGLSETQSSSCQSRTPHIPGYREGMDRFPRPFVSRHTMDGLWCSDAAASGPEWRVRQSSRHKRRNCNYKEHSALAEGKRHRSTRPVLD